MRNTALEQKRFNLGSIPLALPSLIFCYQLLFHVAWQFASPYRKDRRSHRAAQPPPPTFDLFVMVRLQPRFKRHGAVNPLKCLLNLPGTGGGGEGVGSLKESLGRRVAFITPFIPLPGIRQASLFFFFTLTHFVSLTKLCHFLTGIMESRLWGKISWYHKCRPLTASLHTLLKAFSLKRR